MVPKRVFRLCLNATESRYLPAWRLFKQSLVNHSFFQRRKLYWDSGFNWTWRLGSCCKITIDSNYFKSVFFEVGFRKRDADLLDFLVEKLQRWKTRIPMVDLVKSSYCLCSEFNLNRHAFGWLRVLCLWENQLKIHQAEEVITSLKGDLHFPLFVCWYRNWSESPYYRSQLLFHEFSCGKIYWQESGDVPQVCCWIN